MPASSLRISVLMCVEVEIGVGPRPGIAPGAGVDADRPHERAELELTLRHCPVPSLMSLAEQIGRPAGNAMRVPKKNLANLGDERRIFTARRLCHRGHGRHDLSGKALAVISASLSPLVSVSWQPGASQIVAIGAQQCCGQGCQQFGRLAGAAGGHARRQRPQRFTLTNAGINGDTNAGMLARLHSRSPKGSGSCCSTATAAAGTQGRLEPEGGSERQRTGCD